MLPTMLWGFLAPVVVMVIALWFLRRWRQSAFPGPDERRGAMDSPAFEAMMRAAREQREQLSRMDGDTDRPDEKLP